MGAVRQSYRSFVNRLPVVTGTGTNKIYQRRNYTKLLKTVGSSQVLVNPGNYLSFFDNAAFSNFFLNVTAQVVCCLREAKSADKYRRIGGQGFDDFPALLFGGRDKRPDGREDLCTLIRAEAT